MEKLFTKLHYAKCSVWVQLILLVGLLMPVLGHAQSTSVVISEVYMAGATGGAYRNDFVELYNKTITNIDLTGYSVQYNPASGGGTYTVISLAGKTIPANGFLLIQFGSASGGTSLPSPDISTGSTLANAGGRLALVSNTTALADASPANAAGVVDFVGYGTAVTFEGGGTAPAVASSSSIERKAQVTSTVASMSGAGPDVTRGNGYDSNNNNLDFVTRTTPEPQSSASMPEELTAVAVFYNTKNPAGALDDLATYSSTADGTGPSPSSFGDNFQRFTISGAGNHTIAGNWKVSGTNTKVMLLANATFTVPATANFTGLLDLGSGASLVEQNATPSVTLGNVDATSTVEYAQAGSYTVPVMGSPGFGNLTLRNGTKLLSAGTTIVRGNLLVNNVGAAGSDVFGGASASASLLSLGGNLTLTGTVGFSTLADDRIALTATNTSTAQVLNGGGNPIKLLQVTLPSGQAGLSLATGTSNLELGSSTGGYQLATGTVLTVNNNTLSFAAGSKASIVAGSANLGALELSPGSSLSFGQTNNANLGTLLVTPASTQLNNLTVNANGGSTANNTLTLASSLTVNGMLTITVGTLAIGAGNVLTLNGPMSAPSGFLRGAIDADLLIGGTGALSTLRMPTGTSGQLRNLTLNRAGQTLALGSGVVVNTVLTLTDGILDLAGFGLTLNGTVATSAGLLNGSSTSDLTVAGTGPLGAIGFTPTGGVLDILSLNRPGGTLAIVGSPLTVVRPTLTSGILSLGTDVGLTISGVLVVNDPTVAQFAVTPTSSLNFTGTGAIGPLAFVAGQNQLQGLTLNRLTGTVPTAQLLTNLTVNNLALTRGRIFVQGAAKLTILPGGGLSSGGVNGYVNTLTQAAVTNSTTPSVALTFPLGVDGQFRSLTLTVTDQVIGTTSYTAHQFEAPSPVRTLPATLARVSQIRYYNVVPEAGGTSTLGSATIRLSYDAANDRVTPANQSLLRIAMTDPADNTKWKNIGGAGSGADILSDPFAPGPLGDFTLATDINTPINSNPLPVELVRFDATRQASGVAVNWATATEKNSAYFEVQRSLNGREFTTVATATGQGTSSQPTAYAALDKTAPAARLYYRLRQVDLDGTEAFSPVVTVAGTNDKVELTLYPNPATDRIIATLPAAEGRSYRVLNALGQVLDHGPADAANPSVDVRRLPAGTYLLELQGATSRQVRRFVKND
ncbi:lamin tail domain-containing protein [Hymenobacter terricola]|uniref:lamin tail domain-containing protein n=1 Tax=Hymenobacter terricola TaxID=2819236 RepID=UPI00293D886A|nr:lamin tail domain-containing protein [Hymenobacter terricola]